MPACLPAEQVVRRDVREAIETRHQRAPIHLTAAILGIDLWCPETEQRGTRGRQVVLEVRLSPSRRGARESREVRSRILAKSRYGPSIPRHRPAVEQLALTEGFS